jgi:adenine-specific DNA-methyltransferase
MEKFSASLNYIGSKLTLAPTIFDKMKPYLDQYQVKTIGDLFCGSGAMSRYLFSNYNLFVNDIMYYAIVITESQLLNCPNIQKWIDLLNNVTPIDGKITKNYSFDGNQGRKFFTRENGMKLDGMRIQLEKWKESNEISKDEYIKLLGLILHFADKHANTTSVYGAFLKSFKESATNPIYLKNIFDYPVSENNYQITQSDILNLSNFNLDAVYLDPPYNQRSYSKNYSPLETIAKYDDPIIAGVSGLRNDSGDYSGLFCKKSKVKEAFSKLANILKDIPLIFMSYNNEGLLNQQELIKIFENQNRKVNCIKIEYKKYKSNNIKNQKTKSVEEYLFVIEINEINENSK